MGSIGPVIQPPIKCERRETQPGRETATTITAPPILLLGRSMPVNSLVFCMTNWYRGNVVKARGSEARCAGCWPCSG